MFWGIILVIVGLSMIVSSITGIDLPVVRISIAVALVYLGVKVIFGLFHGSNSNESASFLSNRSFVMEGGTEGNGEVKKQREYSTVFGASEIDITPWQKKGENKRIQINAVFGRTVVYFDESAPIRIISNSAFASTRLPGRNVNIIGQMELTSPIHTKEAPQVTITINAAFAEVVFLPKRLNDGFDSRNHDGGDE